MSAISLNLTAGYGGYVAGVLLPEVCNGILKYWISVENLIEASTFLNIVLRERCNPRCRIVQEARLEELGVVVLEGSFILPKDCTQYELLVESVDLIDTNFAVVSSPYDAITLISN